MHSSWHLLIKQFGGLVIINKQVFFNGEEVPGSTEGYVFNAVNNVVYRTKSNRMMKPFPSDTKWEMLKNGEWEIYTGPPLSSGQMVAYFSDSGNVVSMTNCACCDKIASNVCSNCLSTKYCSSKCQTVDWAKHKNICK
jgi:hypothetical protein